MIPDPKFYTSWSNWAYALILHLRKGGVDEVAQLKTRMMGFATVIAMSAVQGGAVNTTVTEIMKVELVQGDFLPPVAHLEIDLYGIIYNTNAAQPTSVTVRVDVSQDGSSWTNLLTFVLNNTPADLLARAYRVEATLAIFPTGGGGSTTLYPMGKASLGNATANELENLTEWGVPVALPVTDEDIKIRVTGQKGGLSGLVSVMTANIVKKAQ